MTKTQAGRDVSSLTLLDTGGCLVLLVLRFERHSSTCAMHGKIINRSRFRFLSRARSSSFFKWCSSQHLFKVLESAGAYCLRLFVPFPRGKSLKLLEHTRRHRPLQMRLKNERKINQVFKLTVGRGAPSERATCSSISKVAALHHLYKPEKRPVKETSNGERHVQCRCMRTHSLKEMIWLWSTSASSNKLLISAGS